MPAVLVLTGFVILRLSDGHWGGIALWILLSPLLYVLADALIFGHAERSLGATLKRPRSAVSSKPEQRRDAATAQPAGDWGSAQDVSAGAEILRRGRRYDRRRA
jgi:hypothetical protein